MERKKSVKRELITSRAANVAIGILGMVLGVMSCIIGCMVLHLSSSTDWSIIAIMVSFFILGAGLIALGILDCIWYRKKSHQMVIFSFAIAAYWGIFSALTAELIAVLLEIIYSFGDVSTGGLLFAASLIDICLYGLASVFFIIALVMASRKRSFKAFGMIGVVLLLMGITIHIGASLYPLIGSSMHALTNFSILEIIRDLILIPIGALLAVVSLSSYYQDVYEEEEEEFAEEGKEILKDANHD